MKPAIAYIRVSTGKQGRSGLGLEAQVAAIHQFCAAYGYELVTTFREVETAKGSDALERRPQLASAIEVARLTGATVISAKLDRITRDVHFGSGLFSRKDVAFKICDMPHADNFQLNIMLSVAQLEREMISSRTKSALAACKARGVKLGSPTGCAAQRDAADARAEKLRAVLISLRHLSSRAIATELTAQGIAPVNGGAWHPTTVLRMIDRLEVA